MKGGTPGHGQPGKGKMQKKPTIVLIGALDTKADIYRFVRERLEADGLDVIYVDNGIFGPAGGLVPEISAEETAAAGGGSLEELRAEKNRGHAMEVMCKGVEVIARRLYEEGRLQGIYGMGGGGGTTVGSAAMRALPIGIPKLLVSTVASSDVSNYVGESDIVMMPSIVDVDGLNRFSAMILSNAAAAISGMVRKKAVEYDSSKPLVAATMFGVTTPCVVRAKEALEKEGYEVLVFHAVGSGGKTLERLIRDGHIAGVLDLTTTELADELAGGWLSAGPNRLTAGPAAGIPQIVSCGALDMVNFGPMDSVPDKYHDRKLVPHNPLNTLMRTTPEENAKLGEIIAAKLNESKGKTVFLIPLKGFSMMDAEGGAFYDPAADEAFIQALKANVNENVEVIEVDANINDPEFSDLASSLLIKYLK